MHIVAPEKLKGVVFDLDGTLIRSTIDFTKMKKHMIEILERNEIPDDILTPTETTVIILEKSEVIWDENGKPEEERVPVRATLEDAMNRGEIEAIPLVEEIDGSTEALGRLRKMGYRLAILTRSHHEYAVQALKKIGAHQYFDVILGRGETPRPKPYHEALDHAAKLMELQLDEIIFVGDHHIDAQSAQNSGCGFIGVGTEGRKRDPWSELKPKVILDSVRDIPDYLLKL